MGDGSDSQCAHLCSVRMFVEGVSSVPYGCTSAQIVYIPYLHMPSATCMVAVENWLCAARSQSHCSWRLLCNISVLEQGPQKSMHSTQHGPSPWQRRSNRPSVRQPSLTMLQVSSAGHDQVSPAPALHCEVQSADRARLCMCIVWWSY